MRAAEPFARYDAALTPLLCMQRSVVTCTLLPLRLLLTVACFATALILGQLAMIGHSDSAARFPAWRHLLFVHPVAWLARAALFGMGFHRIRVRGQCRAKVVVSNHVSYIDAIYLFATLLPSGLTDENTFNDPFTGPMQRALRWICVSKDDRDARRQALDAMHDAIGDPAIHTFVVFPEGRCSNGKQLLAFHRGVFTCVSACGAAVQPVALRYKCGGGCDCSNTGRPADIPWLIVRGMMAWSHEMDVIWLPVMAPDEERQETPEAFAERVRYAMAAALDVPMLPRRVVGSQAAHVHVRGAGEAWPESQRV